MRPGRLISALSLLMVLSIALSCAGLRGKDPAQAEFDLGLSLFNRGRFEEAVPHFERATEHRPDFGEAYLYLGRSYINLGRWTEALHPLRAAYRLSPEETRKKIVEIILDVLLQNATRLDPDTRSQFRDFLEMD